MSPPPEPDRPCPTPAVSVAPMMDVTDRHFRWLMRQLTRRTLLYTEMIPATALLHGDREQLLDFDPIEGPLSLQLGGDDPSQLAECARIASDWGYDEVNLNVGCPSSRVKEGCFGASLMARPDHVARCVEAMRGATTLPITVKHRIGIDDLDSYELLERFVAIVAEGGGERFSIHARKAWLEGLSPKQNRNVPPLHYDWVYRLKQSFPRYPFEINGGISGGDAVAEHLSHVDAVMIGRGAQDDPFQFAEFDARFFGEPASPAPSPTPSPTPSRVEVARAYLDYLARWQGRAPLQILVRGAHGLFAGIPGSRRWRRALGEGIRVEGLVAAERALADLAVSSQSPLESPLQRPAPSA